jgi:hypothetical protein
MHIDRDFIEPLSTTVQKNCDIADALYAGDYTLCVYLLKMREYYRWEKDIPFAASLPSHEVGEWVTAREQRWENLQEEPYDCLQVAHDCHDPFAADRINAALLPRGLVYSAGLGQGLRPHFFLGELQRSLCHGDFTIHVSGRELARDLTAPPAMALGRTVFIRRQSLRRMLWERVEEWGWRKPDNAMGRAVACYDFDRDVDGALDAMADSECESLILHEIGEVMAGEQLGNAWHALLASLPRSQAELMARAVRDHLADCLSTLPALFDLLEHGQAARWHFYIGNLRGMRKHLFPSLDAAYRVWLADGGSQPLRELAERGCGHWLEVARRMLDVRAAHAALDPQAQGAIEALAESHKL